MKKCKFVCLHTHLHVHKCNKACSERSTVYLPSDGNIIGLIFLSHHLTPIYYSVSHLKFNSFFSYLHVPTLPYLVKPTGTCTLPPLLLLLLQDLRSYSLYSLIRISTCINLHYSRPPSQAIGYIHTYSYYLPQKEEKEETPPPKKEKGIAELSDI